MQRVFVSNEFASIDSEIVTWFSPVLRVSDAAPSRFFGPFADRSPRTVGFPAFDVYHEHAGLDPRDLSFNRFAGTLTALVRSPREVSDDFRKVSSR